MITPFEIPDINWSNVDVQRVVEVFGEKYEQKCKEIAGLSKTNAELSKTNAELSKTNAELNERIRQLEQAISQIQAEGSGSRGGVKGNPRSYNTREFKDYPRVKGAAKTREYCTYATGYTSVPSTMRTVQNTADLLFCPIHGTLLSKPTDQYSRTTEDTEMGGGWLITEWTVLRRYCAQCRTQHTAPVENVLPHEHFGINVMSQISVMRNLVTSFESIQKIINMFNDRFIHTSTLEELFFSVSDKCRPLYENMMNNITDTKTMRGDHTGWFLNGKSYYAMVLVTDDTTLFHLAPTKSRMSIEAIVKDYGGIMLSDSDSSWNSVGEIWQKCLLHYLRDIYRTRKDNKSAEFQIFSHELRLILKRAIHLSGVYGEMAVPINLIQKLQRRIDLLIRGTYDDKDCKRYVKRLRREGTHLLTFLKYDIEYHNNASERALRLLARMRKMLYGSRSKRGLEATETMATIYATCERRRINPYHFLIDYLNGRLDAIPNPERDKNAAVIRPTVAA